MPAPRPFPRCLLGKTFCIEHNPNCVMPWLVRLCGRSGVIDKKPYHTALTHRDLAGPAPDLTKDALGFGRTLAQAARTALAEQKKIRALTA